MKSTTFLLLIILFGCKNIQTHRNMDDPFVENLLSKMTMEEKIGQMLQMNGAGGTVTDDLKNAIVSGQVGSVLNEVDVATVNELQRIAVEESRLGIPLLIARDVIHGFKTIFPIPLGQAATWNSELVFLGAQCAAAEARSCGVNMTFAPMIDISRDARWGRIAESLGEDPYLTSVLGAAMIDGFQGKGQFHSKSVLACAKHFAGYGASEGGRDYNTTLIPETELRNIYLPPFKAAVKAGVGSIMTSFNDLNGIPASGNKFLLRNVLREEWGFEGFVISDWESITEMEQHGFVSDSKDAALKAIIAGVDMEMVSTAYKTHLSEWVKEGFIEEDLINAAVYNILKAKKELGLFENPYIPSESQNIFADNHYLLSAQKAATESFVLLKNNGILPFSDKIKTVTVIGPMANQKYEQLGTWIFDGDSTLSVTPLEGLQQKLGSVNVIFCPVLSFSRSPEMKKLDEALKMARKSDAVVLCVGEESILSGEAHCRADITLPGAQEELIAKLSETGTPLVMVVLAGRPLAIGNVEKYADAIFFGFHPGTMTGPAIADLLVGAAIPSGKLPVTFPKSAGQIPIYYNHKNTGRPVNPEKWMHIDSVPVKTPQTSLGNTSHYLDLGYEPLYPFGYGLSYTTFNYSDIKINKPTFNMGDSIIVSAVISNTGLYGGTEVVQLYTRDWVGSITRPVKELKGFKQVTLIPGESKTVTFGISASDLSFYNNSGANVVEPGLFSVWIGGSSTSGLKADFEIVN